MCLPKQKDVKQALQGRLSSASYSTMASLPEFKPIKKDYKLGSNGQLIFIHPLFKQQQQKCQKQSLFSKNQDNNNKVENKVSNLQKSILKSLKVSVQMEPKQQVYFDESQEDNSQQNADSICEWDIQSQSSYADTLAVQRHTMEIEEDFEDFYDDFDFEI